MGNKINAAPQSYTADMIFRSGMDYPWWKWFRGVGDWEHDDDMNAPDGWRYEVCALHPAGDEDSDEFWYAEIGHAEIMRAVRKIADDKTYRKTLRQQCMLVQLDYDKADVDAADADAILQVAVFGKVKYG